MVKRSVTLLEETIFQHVTIHKLMIYIYSKIKMSQDPLLAVIRTNILELKNMARNDPLVLIASSKTILKTLLNFTRLKCIRKEATHFIKTLMNDVYARMRKLWDIYKTHGCYEIPKRIKSSNAGRIVGKENIETKLRTQKKSAKAKIVNKKLADTLLKSDSLLSQAKKKAPNKIELDISTQVRDSVNELTSDDFLNKSALLERITPISSESNEQIEENKVNIVNISKQSISPVTQQENKSPKKRKVKKWSLGIFQAKKKKKVDHSNKTDIKSNVKSTKSREDTLVVPLSKELVAPEVGVPEKVNVLHAKEFEEDDDNSLDKCSDITKDSGWGERLKFQREYYLNEMYKVAHRLGLKKNNMPKYNVFHKISNKLNSSFNSYGYTLKELMARDQLELVQYGWNPPSPPSINWTKKEKTTSNTAIIGLFKASRYKKRFFYECIGDGCSLVTSQIQILYNHIRTIHKTFKWDWSCSSCGIVQQVQALKNADLIDMAMYHLFTYHSSAALTRNPVELEFTALERKPKTDSPLSNQTTPPPKENNGKSLNYQCAQLYKCTNCNFKSGLFSEASNHFALELKEIGELCCIYCRMVELDAHSLCEHIETFHASSIYLCSECYYRSVSVNNTISHYCDEHLDTETKKDILIFVNTKPVGLNTVPSTIYPPAEIAKYVCQHPDSEAFVTLIGSKFVKHISTCPSQGGKRGGSLKKFECSLCGMKIGASYKLRQHYETHQVVRFFCAYCGQGYTKIAPLKEHLYKFHMYWPIRFVIREPYDDCPDEIRAQFSSYMRYETDLEALIEVVIENDAIENDDIPENTNVKLQLLPWHHNNSKNLENKPIEKTGILEGSKKESSETTEIFPENLQSEMSSQSIVGQLEEKQNLITGRISSHLSKGDANVIDLTEDECSSVAHKHYPEASLTADDNEIIEIPSDSEDGNNDTKFIQLRAPFNINTYKIERTNALDESSAKDSLKQLRLGNTNINRASARYTTFSTSKRASLTSKSSRKSLLLSPEDFNEESEGSNNSLALLTLLNPSAPQTITDIPISVSSPSCSHDKPSIPLENASVSSNETRTPGIRVIAEAKMDNFRKSIDASSLVKLDNFTKSEQQTKTKNVQAYKLISDNDASKAIRLSKCPHCSFTTSDSSELTKHVASEHSEAKNLSLLDNQKERTFICGKCQGAFEAFAPLHKHMQTKHELDTFGVFRVLVNGQYLLRKNIKICFLCSTLIASLEQLYKHPDICPFAHTTPLNSSIVYATGKFKKYFIYQKSEVKVNKSIVELLQPHLPTQANQANSAIKRAVARKSTGPRPLNQESGTSKQNLNLKRAVARKSTGPYAVSPTKPGYEP